MDDQNNNETIKDIENVKEFRHKSLSERIAEFDGELDLVGEIDWGEPVGREVW